jgi:hypothetical protein
MAQFDNGQYKRPIEHFSGASTVVSGADLRKVNSVNFIEALKILCSVFHCFEEQTTTVMIQMHCHQSGFAAPIASLVTATIVE